MKRSYFCLASMLLVAAIIFGCSSEAKMHKLQESFIPDVVSNVYIGMSLKQLKEARGIVNLSVAEGGSATTVQEEHTKDSITLITYQFDKAKTLYEFSIEYVPEFKTLNNYKIKYGEMNNGKEWLFTLGKKMKLKIWVYQNRLCIGNAKHFKN